ncbi:MAG: hypothetical protein KDE19_11620 [Caldilineaceae bacterium]|nr:hypothetical protein [Caldilineaceae bacterium]
MNLIPIQVSEEGVLIPQAYLDYADEIEIVTTADYVLIKPKPAAQPETDPVNGVQQPATKRHRYRFIASGRTRNPNASVEAEEILASEIDRRHFTIVRLKHCPVFEIVP